MALIDTLLISPGSGLPPAPGSPLPAPPEISVPDGFQIPFSRALKLGSRFVSPRIAFNHTMLSRARKHAVRQRSYLKQISVAWWALTSGQRADWNTAGFQIKKSGWQLFVQDMSARLALELSGVAIPSILHQSWIGKIGCADFSDEFLAVQSHPEFYQIIRQITGTQSQLGIVNIHESFSLPLEIGINYRSDLIAENEDFDACLYAVLTYDNSGVTDSQILKIDFDLFSGWKGATATVATLPGDWISYGLFLHLRGVKGTLWFDNIEAYHSGQNWAIDPFCNTLDKINSKSFSTVPVEWQTLTKTDGATFGTVYEDTDEPFGYFVAQENEFEILQQNEYKIITQQ